MFSPTIQKLIDLFSKFPAVGPRTAARFVFYLIGLAKEKTEEITRTIADLKGKVKLCRFCFNPFESEEGELCQICGDPSRDQSLLCVVEKETDVMAMEKIKKYRGFYFILGGTVSNLQSENLKKVRIQELIERIKNPRQFGVLNAQFKEVILATNPTTEGQATALYLDRVLQGLGLRIAKLGRGLPIGGELEYADEETLSSALDNRR